MHGQPHSPQPDLEIALTETLFDLAAEYDDMIGRGLRLSGEDRHYFVRGRIEELRRQLGPAARPRRILDFGCGVGDTSRALASAFGDADVLGVDTAERALQHATRTHGSRRIRFEPLAGFAAREAFDLCYVNGVFHHVHPAERAEALARIHRSLAPDGVLAFFENNPWNPGTRLLMRQIPFDRDAIPLSVRESRRLLRAAGFRCRPSRFLFYFPRPLALLRPLEPWLARLPLGAQYLLLAARGGRETA